MTETISIIGAKIFAKYPTELQTATRSNEWISGQPPGMPTGSFLEGPSFDREGRLWCVDLPNGRILRVSTDGVFEVVASYDGWPNGLKIHQDGRVFIADYKHGIMVLDPQQGTVEPYLIRAGLERFKGVNDLFFGPSGNLYFTDQGLTGLHDPTGRLFRLTPSGTLTCLLDNVPSPNGLVTNKEETILYLASTRSNSIWRVPLMPNGTVAKVGTYIQLSGGSGPDGLAMDSEGRLVVAHASRGVVWIFDRLGELVGRINSPSGIQTTNIAFGGPNGSSLFITESGSASILQAELDVAGEVMFSHMGITPGRASV